jgi:hypothetical protein
LDCSDGAQFLIGQVVGVRALDDLAEQHRLVHDPDVTAPLLFLGLTEQGGGDHVEPFVDRVGGVVDRGGD